MSAIPTTYLGDAIYAEVIDLPYQKTLKLFLDYGLGEHHVIIFEPEQIAALKRFIEKMEEKFKNE
jgi:hypothetical protein